MTLYYDNNNIIIITYSYKAQNPTIVAQCADVLMVKVLHGV